MVSRRGREFIRMEDFFFFIYICIYEYVRCMKIFSSGFHLTNFMFIKKIENVPCAMYT